TDRQWLALAGPGAEIRVIDAATGEVRATLNKDRADRVRQVAFDPDGTMLASVGDDRRIRLWDWRNGTETFSAETDRLPAAVEFSADGERIYSRDADSVWIWDRKLHPVGEPIKGHLITAWAFADNQNTIAVVDVIKGKFVIQQYDARNGQDRGQPLIGHTQNIASIDYTMGGSYMVSVGRDASVRFWDAVSGEQVGMYVPIRPVGDVGYLASSDDGSRVFVTAVSVDGPTGLHGGGIWEIPGPATWAKKVCDKLASSPNEEQWDRLVSNDDDLDDVDYQQELCGAK
ncbi:WD40 repeat domain-containing protein, partial [Agromyces sp. NPDC055657]